MDGIVSSDPARGAKPLPEGQYTSNDSGIAGMDGDTQMGDAGTSDSGYVTGTGQLGGDAYQAGDTHMRGIERMSGQGQTEAQIEAQKRKIAQTTKGLWTAGQAKISGRGR